MVVPATLIIQRTHTVAVSASEAAEIVGRSLPSGPAGAIAYSDVAAGRIAEAYVGQLRTFKDRNKFGASLANNAKIAGIMTYVISRDGIDDLFIVRGATPEWTRLMVGGFFAYHLICKILGIDLDRLTRDVRNDLMTCILKANADVEWICMTMQALRLRFGKDVDWAND